MIWTPATSGTDGYILNDGVFDLETKSQVSTLTIAAVKLRELRKSAAMHTFTCKITVGWPIADNQTITIFNPSKEAVSKSVA